MRLAQADILPLDFEFYGNTVNQFLNELEKNRHYDAARLNLASAHKAARELATTAAHTASLLKCSHRFIKPRYQPTGFDQSVAHAGRSQLHPS